MRIHPMQLEQKVPTEELAHLTGFDLDLEAEQARGFARIYVASSNGEPGEGPQAFLLLWIAADELHVIALGTHPTKRRQGLARALVEHVIAEARDLGARFLILEVRLSNQPAYLLYRSLGFKTSRLRRDYYANPREDGIELMLRFDPEGRILETADEVQL